MSIEVIAKWPLAGLSVNQNYEQRDRLEAAAGVEADTGFGGGYYMMSWFADSREHAEVIAAKVKRAAPSIVKVEIIGLGPRAIRQRMSSKENPISQHSINVAVGVGLLALGGYALYKLAAPAQAATQTGQAINFDPNDANTVTPVAVGDTVTFSMPLEAGQSYQVVMTGDSTLSNTPTKQSITSSGESDTYSVVAAGSTTVSYQLYDASDNLVSTTDFKLAATGPVTPTV